MSYDHIFEPKALADYKEAIAWYNERSIMAAENLVKEVKAQIQLICNDPFRYANRYKFFRETSLKRYPYYLIYFIDDVQKIIIITSFYHHKRNPENKYKR